MCVLRVSCVDAHCKVHCPPFIGFLQASDSLNNSSSAQHGKRLLQIHAASLYTVQCCDYDARHLQTDLLEGVLTGFATNTRLTAPSSHNILPSQHTHPTTRHPLWLDHKCEPPLQRQRSPPSAPGHYCND